MGTLRIDFLTCDVCQQFWASDHSPGVISRQRENAKDRGWKVKSPHRHGSDVCAECLPQEVTFDPFDTADEGEVA